MSEEIYQPKSNGKFEFQFDRGIGKNFTTNSEYTYQFAVNSFEKFRETFGIVDEICVMEADMNTWIAMLARILEQFENFHSKNNILNIKP